VATTEPTEALQMTDFAFGGRLSLDLTWTLRYRAVWPTELLAAPDHLCRWLAAVGLPAPAPAPAAGRYLVKARALREAIHRAVTHLIDGRPIEPADLAVINRCATQPTPHPVLAVDGTSHLVAPPGREVAAGLAVVARDAIDLLGAGDGRVRRCEGPLCSLVFHDASRPGTRRWCQATGCGNKVNTKAYRQRHRPV
jgi:predicted RNA-binding Zn ribbon-like protein